MTCAFQPLYKHWPALTVLSPPAIHALRRLPATLTATLLLQSLFRLVASVSERKYANIYARATDVYEIAQRPEVGGDDLKVVVSGLLAKFLGPPFELIEVLSGIDGSASSFRPIQAQNVRASFSSLHVRSLNSRAIIPKSASRASPVR